jgi:hypothetical protein
MRSIGFTQPRLRAAADAAHEKGALWLIVAP